MSSRVRPDVSTGSSVADATRWLDEHGDVLFRYAFGRVRDEPAAEDLVQDTLLAAMGAAQSFRGSSGERTWLIGIMRHKIFDYFRRSARDRQMWSTGAHDDDGGEFDERGRWAMPVADWRDPERSLEQSEFWTIFGDCLAGLPETLRAPFALRELDGAETDELAALLCTTRNNVWVMLSRARRMLRRCLETRWFGA